MLAACECSGRVRDAFAARGWEAWSADLLPSETPVIGTYTNEQKALVSAVGERIGTGYHYQGDVRDLFLKRHPVNYLKHLERQHYVERIDGRVPLWDLVIAFPPCTDLSLAGARWWKDKRQVRSFETVSRQDAAAMFFMQMYNAPAPYVAVENPRGDMTRRWPEHPPDQYVQPCDFGDPTAKKTGLWLKNLPLLVPDNQVDPGANRVATGGGSWKNDLKNGRKSVSTEDSEGRARRDIVRSRTSLQVARAMADQWGSYVEEKELK
jgi:hypothetical protein